MSTVITMNKLYHNSAVLTKYTISLNCDSHNPVMFTEEILASINIILDKNVGNQTVLFLWLQQSIITDINF